MSLKFDKRDNVENANCGKLFSKLIVVLFVDIEYFLILRTASILLLNYIKLAK